MILEEEPRPQPRATFQPAPLEGWSEMDLRGYIVELKAEITRAEAAIAARGQQRAAAEAFFRKPEG